MANIQRLSSQVIFSRNGTDHQNKNIISSLVMSHAPFGLPYHACHKCIDMKTGL